MSQLENADLYPCHGPAQRISGVAGGHGVGHQGPEAAPRAAGGRPGRLRGRLFHDSNRW